MSQIHILRNKLSLCIVYLTGQKKDKLRTFPGCPSFSRAHKMINMLEYLCRCATTLFSLETSRVKIGENHVMGEKTTNSYPSGVKPCIPWEEIKRHNARNDMWIVVDGQIYDVTRWLRKHPGGARIIGHFAGEDASVRSCLL